MAGGATSGRPLPAPGTVLPLHGFVTRLDSVINRPGRVLEDILGYHRGRLARGWALLLLTEPLRPGDFEFAGYTRFSGGRIGHPGLGAARQTADARLRAMLGAQGYDRVKARIADGLEIRGPRRVAKILPAIGHDSGMAEPDQYPPGGGVPQWLLKEARRFIVAAVVPAGRCYRGGGVDGGRWMDPREAQTLQ
ncbi:hypothetical protein [Caldovatus aquaticus]|uniref:Uncharacterized protein n=1 Tax=Caldovatus aquaticus TaxID=2865671 RepID=A0ABS7F142_9PROT|nr:hypothetical protein [Caldovatus aquaticus]MBW8269345.1 hypothetical protein [Caldovatus aquaticus]